MEPKWIFLIFAPLVISCIVFIGTGLVFGLEQGAVVAPGAKIKLIRTGFKFTEGPAVDANGDVYFSDIPAQTIYRWSCGDGSISVYRQNSGMANGLMFDRKRNLIACEMGNRCISLDDMKGNLTVLARSYKDKPFNQPNDLWIHPNGGIYFSDPYYGKDAAKIEKGSMQVYYIAPDRTSVSRVTDDLEKPNGLIGTLDGKRIYIGDHGAGQTWRYAIKPDGTLADKSLFCRNGSDGMTIDEKENIYLTVNQSVLVYDTNGKMIQDIQFEEKPTNLAFAGKDRKTLFVTARPSIYTLQMAVRGAGAPVDDNK